MPLTNLNIGAAPNDGTGETLRSGGAKINTNYTFTVTTDTAQTITGAKTFTATVTGGKFAPTANTVTGNGMYLPTTNTLAFSTNGAHRMRITSGGNVGIGTTSPNAQLNVADTMNIAGNSSISGIYVQSFRDNFTASGETFELTIQLPLPSGANPNSQSFLIQADFVTSRTSQTAASPTALRILFVAQTDRSRIVNSTFGATEVYAYNGASLASHVTLTSSGSGDGTFTLEFDNPTGTNFIRVACHLTIFPSGRILPDDFLPLAITTAII
jgi:hypothetical protein